ncbi:tripartite tricarboxylate transporter substrate binding protein [Salinarimonas rosea]|uniref:tripartite tricarboxylate transporter substrate binding protein n=1 Tax=Salinarimonas rosea TaxID=552063 RepID=UPI0004079A6F|nr:tripartite tricarboxylate transporter substrate binding protein [Salinarimonas rosea]
MRRTLATLALTALAALAPAAVSAFPEDGRPVTIIVPFSAGGTTDVSARLLAEFLEPELGVPVVVVNRPGATTQIGNAELARSEPDGHTLALASLPSLAMTYLDEERQAPYDRESFTPIAHYISGANLLAVLAGSPFEDVNDLVAAAKESPRTVRMGTVGLMSNGHLPGVALEEETGAEFAFVHFDGAAPLVTALLAGDVDVAINGTQTTIPHIDAGAMRAIGFFGARRTAFLPELPTIREQGIDLSAPSSFAVIGPAGMDPAVVEELSAVVGAVIARDAFQERLTALSLESEYMDPAELEAFWSDFDARQARLIALVREEQ